MGGVDVAVDVGLDHAVHGNAAKAPDDLRVVGDFLRAQQDALAVEVDVGVELLDAVGAERERGGRGHAQHAVLDELEHAVLDDLGVGGQAGVAAVGQAGEHGVGDVAHARLQRQQLVGQAAALDLVGEEVEQVAGDLLRSFVRRAERGVAVRGVGFHHRDHLVRVHPQPRFADAVIGLHQRDRHAVGG